MVAVVPAWNRAPDLVRLLGDLAQVHSPVPLHIVVVDNGSDVALESHEAVARALDAFPEDRPVEFLRLPTNRGGSGGFNAGMSRGLMLSPAYLWLVDSDARVEPGCLKELLRAASSKPDVAAVGASIGEPAKGRVFEIGATLNRKKARLEAVLTKDQTPFEVDYAAACCLLVSSAAIRQAGLMPDLFLHSDDVSFCLRLRRATGWPILAAPGARCRHPRFDRYKTWARYYEARNWIVPAIDAGLGLGARLRRGWREIVLASAQVMIGRDDLAHLHTRGLTDAAGGRLVGRAPPERTRVGRSWPWHTLAKTIDAIAPTMPSSAQPIAAIHTDAPLSPEWRGAMKKLLEGKGLTVIDQPPQPSKSRGEAVRGLLRLVLTPPAAIAVVNASAPPHAWSAGRIVLSVSAQGYAIRRLRVMDRIAGLFSVIARGLPALVRLAVLPPGAPRSESPVQLTSREDRRPTLSIVILTRDRVEALLHTIERIEADPVGAEAEIVVVDNASSDGTPATLRERSPRVRIVETGDNLGVEGFNRGVQASTGEAVLILDDDAWPAEGALAGVLDLLRTRPGVDGVMMHRRHPRTDAWEWPFDNAIERPDEWPDMGSGNVVRREAWDAVGGYEQGYFLYRNDTDLALKLLASGREVVFSSEFHVWHDSPIAATKTPAWIRRSTRNWMWLCKRHGRSGSGLLGIALGWVWAHRLARLSPAGHAMAVRGTLEGLLKPAPAMPDSVRPDGHALRRLIRLKMRHRG